MKTLKPLRLGVLTRPYRWQGQNLLGVAVYAWAGLGRQPLLHPDHELWTALAEDAGPETVFDLVVPKTRQEFLLSGHAYACHQDNAGHCGVRIQVGEREKALLVFGDRYWLDGKASEPQPFLRMPLKWEYAWGGPELENPVGKGAQPEHADGLNLKPLPNLEHPGARYRSPSQPGQPVGTGPHDPAWPSRMAMMGGTYDQQWVETTFPALAPDTDWRYFNAAPQDQWLDPDREALEGADYQLWNVHPTQETLEGRIPDWRVDCHISRDADAARIERHPMRLSTAWFFPGRERLALIWHVNVPVREDDARDIRHIMPSLEASAAVARDDAHYLAVMRKRLDRQVAAIEALRDQDLISADCLAPWDALEIPDVMQRPFPRRMQAARRKEYETQAAMMREQGWDPDAFLPVPEAMPAVVSLDDMAQVLLQTREQAEQDRQRAEQMAAQTWQESGLERPGDDARQVPSPDPDREARQLNGLAAELPAQAQGAPDARQAMRQMYFHMAQHVGPPVTISAQRNARLRRRLTMMQGRGMSAQGLNLNGADLSGLDLRGLDFSGALLHDADLSDADLSGCVFDKAVLVRVKGARTQCHATRFCGAHLGLSVWQAAGMAQAVFDAAHLDGAHFQQCRMSETTFAGARFDRTHFDACDLQRSQWSSAFAQQVRFDNACQLQGARFQQVVFYEAAFADSRMQDSHWDRCSWTACKVDARASLAGADMQACSLVSGTAMDGVDASGADFRQCGMRGTSWKGAGMQRSRFEECDLSECQFQGADMAGMESGASRFIRADFQGASLRGANLMHAILQKADLRDADLTGANLFRADVGQAWMDGSTRLDKTYTHQAKWVPLRDEA